MEVNNIAIEITKGVVIVLISVIIMKKAGRFLELYRRLREKLYSCMTAKIKMRIMSCYIKIAMLFVQKSEDMFHRIDEDAFHPIDYDWNFDSKYKNIIGDMKQLVFNIESETKEKFNSQS